MEIFSLETLIAMTTILATFCTIILVTMFSQIFLSVQHILQDGKCILIFGKIMINRKFHKFSITVGCESVPSISQNNVCLIARRTKF